MIFLFNVVNVAQACYYANPDVIVKINNKDQITQQGSIFNELFYPGKSESGIIRIYNNTSKKLDITNLGLTVDLIKFSSSYNKDYIYNSFLNNMRLNVQRGMLSFFMYNVIPDKPIRNLLYKENDRNYTGFNLGRNSFTIDRGSFVDLKYTLSMDTKAENELENLKAALKFKINVNDTSR